MDSLTISLARPGFSDRTRNFFVNGESPISTLSEVITSVQSRGTISTGTVTERNRSEWTRQAVA